MYILYSFFYCFALRMAAWKSRAANIKSSIFEVFFSFKNKRIKSIKVYYAFKR